MKRKKSRMDMLAQQILAMQEELEEVTLGQFDQPTCFWKLVGGTVTQVGW